jgi:hypothetical protein
MEMHKYINTFEKNFTKQDCLHVPCLTQLHGLQLSAQLNTFSCLKWSLCIKSWLGIPIFDKHSLCSS